MESLKTAFIQAYGLEDTEKLNFTYKDDEDNVRFDTTEELALALRTCRGHLRVRASVAAEDEQDVKEEGTSEDTDRGIYAMAARRLAATSDLDITPEQLQQLMGLLRIPPRRLHQRDLVDSLSGSGSEDIVEEPAGAEEKEEVDKAGHATTQREARQQRKGVVIHSVLVDHGVRLRPRDVQPLLRALGVGPRRFVRVGLIDPSEFGYGGRLQHGEIMKKTHGHEECGRVGRGGRGVHGFRHNDYHPKHASFRGGKEEGGVGFFHPGPHPHHQGPYPHHQGPNPHHQGPYPHHQGPYPHHQGPYPHHQGPYPHHQGPYPHHQDPYPHHQGPNPHHQGPNPHHQGPCFRPGAWGQDNIRREKEGSGKDRKWRPRGCGRYEHPHGGMGRKMRQDRCFAPHPHMPCYGHV
ncbi:unnamed protein product [Discosporangium mesarthrocarpum]